MPEAPPPPSRPRLPEPRPRASLLGRVAGLAGLHPGRGFKAAGDAARRRRDWHAAIAAYAEALRRAPWRSRVWVLYGHALKEAGLLPAAEQAYRDALSLDPDHPDTLLHLSHLLHRRGAGPEATALLLRGLRRAPTMRPLVEEAGRVVRAHLGFLSDAAGAALLRRLEAGAEGSAADLARAEPVVAELAARHPGDAALARLRARLLEARGAGEEAARALGEVLWHDPCDEPTRQALIALKSRLNAVARQHVAARHGAAAEDLPASIRFIAFGTTGVCNASCIHCPTGKPETAHVPRTTMPMPLFERILREMAELHLTVRMQVSFGLFGDGLVDPLVLDRVRLVRRLLPDAVISVNTNGAAYNPAKHKAIFEQTSIIAVHCESLRPEVYDELMAPLRLRNVRPKIEAILRDFPGKVHVSVPLSRRNRDEVPDIVRWFRDRGAANVQLDALSSRCATDRSLFDSLALRPQIVRCEPEIAEDLIIDCDGRVMICCQDFRREEPIGDLSRQSLVETLLSPERRRLREQFAQFRHAERKTCARCFGDPVPTQPALG